MLKNRRVLIAVTALTVALVGLWVFADTDLAVFKAGDPIKADEINANFQNIADALPVKFDIVITEEDIICKTFVNQEGTAKSCYYFFDHPLLNAKPDAWIFITSDCSLIGKCYKNHEFGFDVKYFADEDAYYDRISQRWFRFADSAYLTCCPMGFNVTVIP